MTDTYTPNWLVPPPPSAFGDNPPQLPAGTPMEPSEYVPEWLKPPPQESQPREGEAQASTLPPLESQPHTTPKPPGGDPGFLGLMGEAATAGWNQNTYETGQLLEGLKRKLSGGTFFQPPTEPAPEIPSEVNNYLQMPFRKGWNDPRWYGVNLAYGIPSMATQLGASAVGSVAGPVGLGVGFGLAGGSKTLIPAMKEAEAKGLRGNDAASYALQKGVLTGAFDAASTAFFGIPVAGPAARKMAAGVFGDAAGPFLADAAVQLGLIQPSVEAARIAAQSRLLEGRDAAPMEMFDAVTANVGMNVFQMGAVHALNRTIGGMRPEKPFVAPTEEQVKDTFKAIKDALVPEGGTQPPGEEQPLTGEIIHPRGITDIADLRGVAEQFPRNSAFHHEWVDWLKGKMPHEADALDRLDVPRWIGGEHGKITKTDFLTHVDEKQTTAEAHWDASHTRGILRFERMGLETQGVELPIADRIDRDGMRTLAVDSATAPPRILRYAADNGFDRIAFMGDKAPKELVSWARKMGMNEGLTTIDNLPRHYVELSPAAASTVRVGYPQWERPSTGPRVVVNNIRAPAGEPVTSGVALRPAANLVSKIAQQFARKFGIKRPIIIDILNGKHPDPAHRNSWGSAGRMINGDYRIRLPLANHVNAESVYQTMAHEFGHVTFFEHWDGLKPEAKLAILEEYKKWRREQYLSKKAGATHGEMELARENAVFNYYMDKMRNMAHGKIVTEADKLPMSALGPEWWRYWAKFEEWVATQTGRWATTDARPLSTVDSIFSSMGKRVRDSVEFMQNKAGMNVFPGKAIQGWFEDLLKNGEPWAADSYDAVNFASQLKSQAALNANGTPQVQAVPQTLATQPGRNAMGKLPPVEGAAATAAHADRFHWLYNQWISLPQLVARNPHIQGLVRYGGWMRILNQKINTTMNGALETLQAWRNMGSTQREAVGNLIRDYMMQTYRTANEVKNGVSRQPTAAELNNIVMQHKVDATGLKVFKKVLTDMNGALDRYHAHMLEKTRGISDPIAQAQAIQDVNAEVAKMRSQPYFPMSRFGDYTITVYDANNKVVRFELADNVRQQKRTQTDLEKTLLPGERLRIGRLNKDTHPFIGLPSGLLDTMAQKMNLSKTQREALEQLKFDYVPARSFAHHFRTRSEMAGWSHDFIRAYAQYFFNYSRWMAKAELIDDMNVSIDEVRKSTIAMADSSKRDQIVNFMVNHQNSIMDPKGDFAALRGFLFHMYLGANPASAVLNLTQTLTSTYPWLGAKFGDFKAIGAMLRASSDLTTYYKKGTLTTQTQGDLWMLGEAVRRGLISEGQAHNLAAMTQMDNLNLGFGRTAREKTLNNLLQASSFMFEHAEQWNRRVAMRAAWKLALENPNAKYVQEAIQLHPLEYESIIRQGRNPREAAAFVTAMDAVEGTQYVYAPYGRPAAFRKGLASVPLVFKLFTQNTLFQMWNYPGVRMRGLLMFAALGGLTGVPGAQDILGLVKGIAYRLFGKDFDVEDEARKFTLDVLKAQDCANVRTANPICPDILLHGLSRHGFGIPQLFDMLGHTIGLEKHIPIPSIDMSAAVGMGRVLPIEMQKILGPEASKNPDQVIARSLQNVGGAGFGYAGAMYRALTDQSLDATDWKRWEGIMPRFTSNISHAWRYYQEGMERNRAGNPILKFDPNEPVQMAEIIARSLGFQPARLTQQWERIGAEAEGKAFWTVSHDVLIRQLWHAKQRNDTAAFEKTMAAIKNFNAQVPEEARGYRITSENIRRSFQQRALGAKKQEMGVPAARRDIPLIQEIQRLHPGAEPIGRQRVD